MKTRINNEILSIVLVGTTALTACEQQSGSGSLAFPTTQKTTQPEASPKSSISRTGTVSPDSLVTDEDTSNLGSSLSSTNSSTTDCAKNPSGNCISGTPATNQHLAFNGTQWVPSTFVSSSATGTFQVASVSGLSFSNNTLSLAKAGSGSSGYLSAADFNTFNSCLKPPSNLVAVPSKLVALNDSNVTSSISLPNRGQIGNYVLKKESNNVYSFVPAPTSTNTVSNPIPTPTTSNQVLVSNSSNQPAWSAPAPTNIPTTRATAFFGSSGTTLGWFAPPAGNNTQSQAPYLPPMIRFTSTTYLSNGNNEFRIGDSIFYLTNNSKLNTECSKIDLNYEAANHYEILLNYKINKPLPHSTSTFHLNLTNNESNIFPNADRTIIDNNTYIYARSALSATTYPIACIHKSAPLRVFNLAKIDETTPPICKSGYRLASIYEIAHYLGSGYGESDKYFITSDSTSSTTSKIVYYIHNSGIATQSRSTGEYPFVCIKN